MNNYDVAEALNEIGAQLKRIADMMFADRNDFTFDEPSIGTADLGETVNE